MTVKIKVKDKLEDETLDLSWCDLKEVPIKEIATIKKASHLDLSNNQLVSLPKTIVSLRHIVKLDLSKNLLTEIPENIGEMKQLRYLDLYSNQISRLPLSMGDLKSLKWLDLKDNPLTSAVASVAGPCSNTTECQQCARNIVSYLTHIRQTIEEERKRRSDATTAASAPASANKKENKKKKKKNAAKDEKQNQKEINVKAPLAAENDENDRVHSGEESKEKPSKSTTPGVCSSVCRLIYSTLAFFILLGIFLIFTIILLPRFNQPLSDQVITYVQQQTALPVREYQSIGIQKFDASTELIVSLLNRTKTLVSDTFTRVIGEQHKCCGN